MELVDCLNEIVPENLKYLSDEEEIELYELCQHMMDEYVGQNYLIFSDEDFSEEFDENIHELIHSMFDDDIYYTDEFQDEINEIIQHAKNDFFEYIIYPRSHSETIIINELDDNKKEAINKKIYKLQSIHQPLQRTNEWYQYRYNLITASNAYKIFDTQASMNQLIYEKCKPMVQNDLSYDSDVKIINIVNTDTTLHWGNKYEPLSVKIYELKYNTKIGDFGCIKHNIYSFLGASPDGINIDPSNERYGRMLEIKNIVNREITGIPKKEYWIQMQLQMEVCDLDECDFLETKFIEYENYDEFKKDSLNELNVCSSLDSNIKGIIIHFHKNDGSPHYLYKPLDSINGDIEINNWIEENISLYESEKYNYMYVKIIYWKLEIINCVLVCRNREWFKSAISEIERVWSIIEKERIDGFDHRMPKKRCVIEEQQQQLQSNENNIKTAKININFSANSEPKCLLKIIKKICE